MTNDFWVNGIVAVRDGKPYIQLSNEKGIDRAVDDEPDAGHTGRGTWTS